MNKWLKQVCGLRLRQRQAARDEVAMDSMGVSDFTRGAFGSSSWAGWDRSIHLFAPVGCLVQVRNGQHVEEIFVEDPDQSIP